MEEFRTRIGKVKLKNGPEIVRLPEQHRRDEKVVRDVFNGMIAAMDNADPIAGYAIVLWDREGRSIANFGAREGSPIPTILIPDFVRNLLLARRIETWTIDTINEQVG